MNAIGQQVKPIRHGLSSGTTIDFSGMADGMYLLVLTFPNGREIKRVIKIT
ncbi:T9SS type A sorting domain-containing protein [Pontibacter sp. SGAir0037]|uniref:T9SS type A sorting domain-containing protein n=1 Tax=Pontibacter sp. SGAir0037 TaxID=2571030 RepID=UPI00143DF537|nr:T9SS type A sorting domain-containing protein [Pontibacter sp. SGAir0037]